MVDVLPKRHRESSAWNNAVVIHPGLDTAELQAFSAERQSWRAAWRQRDFDFFTSEKFQGLLALHDVS
jgi:hypothetical protein